MQIRRRTFRKVLEVLAVEDYGTLLRLTLQKLTHPLFNVYHIFEADLLLESARSQSAKPLPAGITIQLFYGQRGEHLAAKFSHAGVSPEVVEQRIERGDVASVAFAGGDVAGYSWVTFKEAWIAELRGTLALRSDEAVQFNTRVMPPWRGKGLQYALTMPLIQYLTQHDYRRMLGWVYALNARSARNSAWPGKRVIATVVCFPILGIMHVRDRFPAVHVSIERNQRKRS